MFIKGGVAELVKAIALDAERVGFKSQRPHYLKCASLIKMS